MERKLKKVHRADKMNSFYDVMRACSCPYCECLSCSCSSDVIYDYYNTYQNLYSGTRNANAHNV